LECANLVKAVNRDFKCVCHVRYLHD